jgi:S-adenosylmethionine decarboxylase
MALVNRHVLYDVWLEDRTYLTSVEALKELMCRAAEAGGATVIHEYFHEFSPPGVTGFLLLAESHLSVHTWVEEGFAAFDIFTCGPMDTDKVLEALRAGLQPRHASVRRIVRGGDTGPAYSNTPSAGDASHRHQPHHERRNP